MLLVQQSEFHFMEHTHIYIHISTVTIQCSYDILFITNNADALVAITGINAMVPYHFVMQLKLNYRLGRIHPRVTDIQVQASESWCSISDRIKSMKLTRPSRLQHDSHRSKDLNSWSHNSSQPHCGGRCLIGICHLTVCSHRD